VSPEEIKGSGPHRKGAEVEIDLKDDPGSLLGSLNAWREKVIMGSSQEFLGFLAQ